MSGLFYFCVFRNLRFLVWGKLDWIAAQRAVVAVELSTPTITSCSRRGRLSSKEKIEGECRVCAKPDDANGFRWGGFWANQIRGGIQNGYDLFRVGSMYP